MKLRLYLALLLLYLLPLGAMAAPLSQNPPPPIPETPVFGLPFNTPPGPSTWLPGQYYGNTRTAYVRRREWYAGGQGLHFGLDLSAPCGTPVVAIGDGYILKVDAAEHGAGPHNLVIMHDNGFASLYGHLNERPPFARFTRVNRGAVIGVTGDPDLTCTSRPHLHLEIRDASLYFGYNPIPFIEADWEAVGLIGSRSGFQRDLLAPRRWQLISDQPLVQFGGPIVNEFDAGWPPAGQGW